MITQEELRFEKVLEFNVNVKPTSLAVKDADNGNK